MQLEGMWNSGGMTGPGTLASMGHLPYGPYSMFPPGFHTSGAYAMGAKQSQSETISVEKSAIPDSTHATGANMEQTNVSVDDVLKASAQAGDISKDDLARIHRIIGYDNTTSQQMIEENMSDAPSKLAYTRAWEKLSTRLESLEDLRSTVAFTKQELNPYMSTESVLGAPEGLLALSKELFEKGDTKNAILACEAEVQKHGDHSEGTLVVS